MPHVKHAQPEFAVLECIAQRWSPYRFQPRSVEVEKLASCLEAARWSASSFNEQPWSFLVARREEPADFQRLLGCLLEANQAWAQHAGVLLLTVVGTKFSHNGQPNRTAQHDLGLAMGNFSCQATQLGLTVHQMAGLNLSRARQEFAIPEAFEPVTAVAVGYASQEPTDDSPLAKRDAAPRARKQISQFTFSGAWSRPAGWLSK